VYNSPSFIFSPTPPPPPQRHGNIEIVPQYFFRLSQRWWILSLMDIEIDKEYIFEELSDELILTWPDNDIV